MAKKSKIARNEQRKETVERYAARRAELKEVIRRPSGTDDERRAALAELRRQPRDASATRVRNRDSVDGRPAVIFEGSDSPAYGCASRPTPGSFRASPSLPGSAQPHPADPSTTLQTKSLGGRAAARRARPDRSWGVGCAGVLDLPAVRQRVGSGPAVERFEALLRNAA